MWTVRILPLLPWPNFSFDPTGQIWWINGAILIIHTLDSLTLLWTSKALEDPHTSRGSHLVSTWWGLFPPLVAVPFPFLCPGNIDFLWFPLISYRRYGSKQVAVIIKELSVASQLVPTKWWWRRYWRYRVLFGQWFSTWPTPQEDAVGLTICLHEVPSWYPSWN